MLESLVRVRSTDEVSLKRKQEKRVLILAMILVHFPWDRFRPGILFFFR